MNPYPQRIEDLHLHLARRYGQVDRQATEILLAALLPKSLTRAAPPWFVIETDYPNRDTRDAWFSFGGIVPVESVAAARIQRADTREKMVTEWLDTRKTGAPGLFVDAEWRRLTHLTSGRRYPSIIPGMYGLLMSQCLRLRVAYPKGAHGADCDRDVHRAELERLTRRVLDHDHRTVRPCVEPPPRGMYYWVELLQKLSTQQSDWDVLIAGLAAVARSTCTLYNDTDRGPDWTMSERLIRDMVNWSTTWILEQCSRKKSPRAWDTYMTTGYNLNRAWNAEIRRLRREGVIDKGYLDGSGYRKFKVLNEDWRVIADHKERMFA